MGRSTAMCRSSARYEPAELKIIVDGDHPSVFSSFFQSRKNSACHRPSDDVCAGSVGSIRSVHLYSWSPDEIVPTRETKSDCPHILRRNRFLRDLLAYGFGLASDEVIDQCVLDFGPAAVLTESSIPRCLGHSMERKPLAGSRTNSV